VWRLLASIFAVWKSNNNWADRVTTVHISPFQPNRRQAEAKVFLLAWDDEQCSKCSDLCGNQPAVIRGTKTDITCCRQPQNILLILSKQNEYFCHTDRPLAISTPLQIRQYVFFYSIEQHSKFLLPTLQVLYMCAPYVILQTSTRKSSSFRTVCSISAVIIDYCVDVCRITKGALLEHL